MAKPTRTPVRRKGRHFSEERDALFLEIVDMMVNCTWISGQSHLTLAKREGVHVDHIRRTACEASRFIRLSLGDDDDIRQSIVSAIDLGTRLAVDRKKPALSALENLLRLKAEVRLSGTKSAKGPQEPAVNVPVEELNALLAASGYEVTRTNDTASSPTSSEDAERPDPEDA